MRRRLVAKVQQANNKGKKVLARVSTRSKQSPNLKLSATEFNNYLQKKCGGNGKTLKRYDTLLKNDKKITISAMKKKSAAGTHHNSSNTSFLKSE
jgi:hypothetical protein